jgi:hypothetical protein
MVLPALLHNRSRFLKYCAVLSWFSFQGRESEGAHPRAWASEVEQTLRLPLMFGQNRVMLGQNPVMFGQILGDVWLESDHKPTLI